MHMYGYAHFLFLQMPEGLGVVYVEIKERRRPEEEVQEEETGSGFQTEREGVAEGLLNNETLLNESLWNDGKRSEML